MLKENSWTILKGLQVRDRIGDDFVGKIEYQEANLINNN